MMIEILWNFNFQSVIYFLEPMLKTQPNLTRKIAPLSVFKVGIVNATKQSGE